VTGNPETRRDFTDVRDVVAAYRALAGSDADPGAYNVCSGVTASAAELVAALAAGCDVEIEHTVDERLLRPHEVMEIRGSFARLQAATGWEPRIALERTLADAVAWWREEIRAGRAGERISEAN
jgi:GDP-4-dehydro-6-deoxy-D-mannose reductase